MSDGQGGGTLETEGSDSASGRIVRRYAACSPPAEAILGRQPALSDKNRYHVASMAVK